MVRKLLFLIISILTFSVIQPSLGAMTRSIPVELTIPETILQIDGRASPNALVAIKESGVTIVSTVADAFGLFSTSVSRTAGIHTISSEYTDNKGNKSQINVQSISLQPQQTTVRTVYLSPTIGTGSAGTIVNGSVIQIRGYTVPNSQVSLKIDYGSFLFDTVSNANGFYEFLVDSAVIGDGNHVASVTSTSGAFLSDPSKNITFQVVPVDEPSAPDIIVRPSQLPPPIAQTPEDGAVIDGNRVTIYGESVPNAQINIYENNTQIGSVFADGLGKWSFEYTAISSPVTLSFEACLGGKCSVLSKTLTLTFIFTLTYTSDDINNTCGIDFGLEKYRFWGVAVNQEVNLVPKDVSIDGIFEIYWGDSTDERFDFAKESSRKLEHVYSNKGSYNGKIIYRKNADDTKCHKDRYFSVLVSSDSADGSFYNIIWLLMLLVGLLGLNYIVSKDKQ